MPPGVVALPETPLLAILAPNVADPYVDFLPPETNDWFDPPALLFEAAALKSVGEFDQPATTVVRPLPVHAPTAA